MDMDRLPQVYSLAGHEGISWCKSQFLPTNSGVKIEKKGFRHEIEISSFILAFTRVYCPERRFYSCLGGHQQYFGGAQFLKCTPVAPSLLLSFGAQSSLGEHISSPGGHKQ